METDFALQNRAQVAEFQRKHRIGLLALLFTDIVGSTALKQELGDREGVARIQRHHAVVRETLRAYEESQEIGTAGDSFFIVFAKPSDAVKFALQLQARLRALAAETGWEIMDRIGIHVGEVFVEKREAIADNLYGIQVDTCSRVMGLGDGGQTLMTRFAFDSARQVLRGEDIDGVGTLAWINHGPYALKGVEEPLEICEAGERGVAPLNAPETSEKAHRFIAPGAEPVTGWRPALGERVPNTKWTLEQKLGEGGFGEVWLGRHDALDDYSVFKFCFRADRVRSLKREVTLFRLLKGRVGEHPNIVGVQEVNFDEAPYYIMMKYAGEMNLRAWCDALGGVNAVPLAARLDIVATVADALQAAHEAGVIHRDIKPSNILVKSPEGVVQVRLTDFGIGQVVSRESLEGLTEAGFTQTLVSTESGSQLGTQVYMAPELLAGGPAAVASPASDIYSLGVVLYQLIAGDLTRPLTGEWREDVGDPILKEDLARCIAHNPANRFQSAAELASELRSYETRSAELVASRAAEEQRVKSARSRKASLRTVIAIFVLVVLGGAGFFGWNSVRKANEAKEQALARSKAENHLDTLVDHARTVLDNYRRDVTEAQAIVAPGGTLSAAQETKRKQLQDDEDQKLTTLGQILDQVHLAHAAVVALVPPEERLANPWKRFILTTQFWIGERPHGELSAAHLASAWDANWVRDYGGFDTPATPSRKNFTPTAFKPGLNPFYCALPYNDLAGGKTKEGAKTLIPWFNAVFVKDGQSVCKYRWVEIRNPLNDRVAYAQWSDAGPEGDDDGGYVFGKDYPDPSKSYGLGMTISPGVREYLRLGGLDIADWRFVDFKEVPPGPWAWYGANNDFEKPAPAQ
jgi:class 3 adenylate cyclase/tRNA A-37 threonylcarbamoyl transferase component Bud32